MDRVAWIAGLGLLLAQVVLVAKLLGVSRITIYQYVPELAGEGGALVAAATPNALPPGEFMIDPLANSAVLAAGTAVGPTCGTAPETAHDRFRLRGDLAVLWLYADSAQ